jgi:tetratricopeptide (TPR) repeat protein
MTDQENLEQEIDDAIDYALECTDPIQAIDRLNRLLVEKKIPKEQNAIVYQVLGTRFEDLGKNEKAIECYTQSLESNPDNAIVLFWKGQLLFRIGDYKAAKSDLEKSLAVSGTNALTWPDRANAQEYISSIDN